MSHFFIKYIDVKFSFSYMKKNMVCSNMNCNVFRSNHGANVIVAVLLQKALPLHLFSCSCSKLKSVPCALACCIAVVGSTANPADNIATAPKIPTISKVEFLYI